MQTANRSGILAQVAPNLGPIVFKSLACTYFGYITHKIIGLAADSRIRRRGEAYSMASTS